MGTSQSQFVSQCTKVAKSGKPILTGFVELEGWLHKRPRDALRSYKPRYFRQKGSRLLWFHANKLQDEKAARSIDLSKVRCVRRLSSTNFCLKTNGRELHLRAPNRKEAQWWVDNLQHWLQYYSQQTPVPKRGSDVFFSPTKPATTNASSQFGTAEFWIHTLRLEPSVTNVRTLQSVLRLASSSWLAVFVELEGLRAICGVFHAKEIIETKSIIDCAVLEGCTRCLTAIKENKSGVESIVCSPNRQALRGLVPALATRHIPMATSAAELLVGVSFFSPDGLRRCIDALDSLRAARKETSPFTFLVQSLENVDDLDYKCHVLAVVRALLTVPTDMDQRLRIKADLLKLDLPYVMKRLKLKECPELEFPMEEFALFEEQAQAKQQKDITREESRAALSVMANAKSIVIAAASGTMGVQSNTVHEPINMLRV